MTYYKITKWIYEEFKIGKFFCLILTPYNINNHFQLLSFQQDRCKTTTATFSTCNPQNRLLMLLFRPCNLKLD